MSQELNYQTAYETLLRAIDEAALLLEKAHAMTAAGLRMQREGTLDEEALARLRAFNSPT